jgi:hypothetical protein
MRRRTVKNGVGAALILVLVVGLLAGPVVAAQGPGEKGPPGRYIVQFREGVEPGATAADVAREHGLDLGHVYTHALSGCSCFVPPGRLKALQDDPRVKLVEPDIEVHTAQQTLPTGVDRINADENDEADIDGIDERVDVDIAILDTGIDEDHPDLNVVGGTHFYYNLSGPWWTWGPKQDSNYDDDNGHGSHVAGIAAAIDNDTGVVGAAPGARLWAIKVLDKNGSGYLSDIIAGVDWVTAKVEEDGTTVIEVANMSLAGVGYNYSFWYAIMMSSNKGVVYVAAAGNSGTDVYGADGVYETSDDIIPAAFTEVATISAMVDTDGKPGGDGSSTSYGSDDSFASFSNFSRSVKVNVTGSPGLAIDLLLPGVSIYSTYKNGDYATMSGTSMASPHAAGLAALHIAANGRAVDWVDVCSIRQALVANGMDQASGNRLTHPETEPDEYPENLGWAGGSGAPEPLTDVAVTSVTAPSSVVQGDVVEVSVTVENVGNQDVTSDIAVTLTSNNTTIDTSDDIIIGTKTIGGSLTAGASTTLSYSWDTAGASIGDHTLTASHDFTDDNAGNDSGSTTVTVTEEIIDIAVASVSAPSPVMQGDLVDVDVTVENVGNRDVPSDITVTLTDDTDSTTIGTQTISGGLTAGALQTLTFYWDTTDATPVTHTLTASHDFTDDGLSNNSASTIVTVDAPAAGISVESITPSSMAAGSTIEEVVIAGSGFLAGAQVSFENGKGPAPEASVIAVDCSTITATVTAKSGGPPKNREWDVRVTNPDGSSAVLVGGFTVTP